MNLTLEQKIEVLRLVEPYRKDVINISFCDYDITVTFRTKKSLCLINIFGNKEEEKITYVDDFEKFKEILKERMEAENGN